MLFQLLNYLIIGRTITVSNPKTTPSGSFHYLVLLHMHWTGAWYLACKYHLNAYIHRYGLI